MKQRFARLALGGTFGAALVAAALAFTPTSAFALECVDTASMTCCESSTGKVSCFARPAAGAS